MERNGDVATEFNSCRSENFYLNASLFETGCDKMCKDDNSESLFCKMSGKMRSDNVMTSGFEAEHKISISALKNQCLEKLSRSESDFVNNDQHVLSVIHQKTEDAMDNCMLPIWKKTAKLCGNPLSVKPPGNFLLSDSSFVNGERVMNDTKNSFPINSSCINSNAAHNSDSSLGAISDSLQHTYVEELSSSSIEEISVSSPVAGDFNKMKRSNIACSESKKLLGSVSSEKDSANAKVQSAPHNLSFTIPKLEMVKEIESSPKSEMPELIPTICLDDDDEEDGDDESLPSMEKKSCEKVNVAGSPEMPKLVPFSTDIEDIMKIKKERLDSDEIHKSGSLQLLTSAKRKLFVQYETDSVNGVKKSKPDVQLKDRGSKSSSPETFTLEDSMSYQSGAIDSENGTSLNKESQKFENPDFRNFFSEMNRNLKLLDESDKRSEDSESQSPLKPSHQPEIQLRTLSLDNCLMSNSADKPAFHEASAIEGGENESKFSFKHCLPSNDSDDNDSLTSKPECQDNKNSSSEGPEIEEIEGVRFFQFRSKHAMEEFNKIPPEMEMSVEMIVPTKTTDITQIKGWRNKYFAPDTQLQFSCGKSESNVDECSQNAVSLPPLDEQVDNKCVDFCIKDKDVKSASLLENKNLNDSKCLVTDSQLSSEVLTSTPIKSDLDGEKSIFCSEVLTSSPIKSDVDEKDKFCSIQMEKSDNSVPNDPMSAFVSKKLDDFLLNSSTLNISFLQKVNPNIKSIPPDAPILGIGKLRKADYNSNSPYKTKFFYKIRDERDEQAPTIPTAKSSPAPVITLSSSDESSSDDDIPVADLYSKVNQTRSRPTRSQQNKCMKRRTSDSSTDQAAQRVVLRLTKQSRGTTEGYKVSGISVEKQGPEESSSNLESEETLPDVFKKPADGSLSTIKDGIFLKESEPKLLEEFLNNLNMYGTSKDVAMLVQSNQSYFVKGPVLTAESCSEALDALASNKEFLDLKNKATPKKKLKTWQKYLPKKLSKTQQQQISYKASHHKNQNTVANFDSSERLLNAKEKIKQTKNEEQLYSSKASQPQKSGLIKSKNLGKVSDSKDGTLKLDDKAKFPNDQKTAGLKKSMKSKHLILQKKREMRRKTKLNIGAAQLALIERGKRSIRLPARYLDSAVLAAGTEWVSPIFVEDEKKTRKQLLDVLDKITPSKETDIASEKSSPNVSNHTVRKKSLDSDKQQKRISKESVASKKQKGDNTKQNTKAPKHTEKQNVSIGSKNLDENASFNEILYPMPPCTCSPCSRTASFQKVEKSFVCFSEHNRNNVSAQEKNNHEKESLSKDKSIKTGRDSPEITITKVVDLDKSKRKKSYQNSIDQANKKIKSLSFGDSLTAQESNQNKSSTPKCTVSNSVNVNTPLLKKSLSSSSIIIANENYRTQSPSVTKMVCQNSKHQGIDSASNKSLHPNLCDSISNEFNSNQNRNVSRPGPTNKVLLIVPPIKSAPKNASVPILQNTLSIQKVQKIASEGRSKPPILARKTVPENQISSSKNILVPSPLSSLSSLNPTSVILKFSENADKRSQVYKSSYNSASSVLSIRDNSKSVSNTSQQSMPLYKAIPLPGNMVFCTTETKSSPLNSNLNSTTVSSEQRQDIPSLRTSEMPVNNAKVPILQTALKTDSLNSDLLEMENTNVSSVSQKTYSETMEHHHNYHKRQSSDHRRKSPLSERKFNDSSDSEVDVDTIDQDFDAVLSLKQHYAECDADAFDNDCAFTFLSDLSTLLSPYKRKTISERNRRQLIANMSDKLRKTSGFFQNAKSLAEILNRASIAVRHLSMQNQSHVIAKKILQFRNAQLLEKLSSNIQVIPDSKSRSFVKKKVIQTTACAWQRDVQHRKKISSSMPSTDSYYSSAAVETNSSSNRDHSILNGSQKHALSELDSEIEGTPKKNNQNECHENIPSPKETGVCVKSSENEAVKNVLLNCETVEQAHTKVEDNYIMATDVTEQPHVQLRILEASPNGEEIEIKEKSSGSKTPEISHEEASTPSSACKAKRRLQFRVSSDANTSDDDHLVIDLSDDNTNPEDASSPQKDLASPASSKTAVGSSPMKKFPGLIPLFASDFLEEHNKLERAKPRLVSRTKSADSGANEENSVFDVNQKIVAIRTSIPGLVSIQPGTL
ncbi:hypothetical protein AVEN_58044-1 [Araneus ventricosus]|uniref:Uncharacterized protein n=1 Tax=Araneus ventricosus TaxID=182803 RepID=A0A4Y2J7S0_ARAVE|nr:hypothetical protein AVEN_58044-1 [Araneus ventricosus]